MEKLTSIASIQTKGLKRYFYEEQHDIQQKLREKKGEEVRVDSLRGSKRKPVIRERLEYDKSNPNIVGFESSGDDESSCDDEEIEKKRPKLDSEEVEIVENEGKTEELESEKVEIVNEDPKEVCSKHEKKH